MSLGYHRERILLRFNKGSLLTTRKVYYILKLLLGLLLLLLLLLLPFTALWLGLSGWAGTRRNIHSHISGSDQEIFCTG